MANGVTNPYQAIGQQLAERQQQGLQAIQQILAGQLPQIPGMPGGAWIPDVRTTQQLANLALEVLERTPTADLSRFEQAFIQPLLSGPWPAQQIALNYYTQRALQTGDLSSFPFAQFPGGSARAIAAQSQALTRLGQQFADDPRYQELLRGFISAMAPTGQATALSTPAMMALAAPYFQQVELLGSPEAAGLPQLAFPTTTDMMPASRRQAIENIAQMALATQGLVPTPTGVERMTAREYFNQLVQSALDALGGLIGIPGLGTQLFDAAGAAGATAGATGATEGDIAPPVPQTERRREDRTTQALRERRQVGIQGIKQELLRIGASREWALSSLEQNRANIVAALGEEGWEELRQWAQNLPSMPGWQPPYPTDPILAAIDVVRGVRGRRF